MRTTRITVSFSRQVSDGSYGSETIRHEVVVEAEDGEDLDSKASIMALALCRKLVHAELAESPNWQVRRAVEDISKLRDDEQSAFAPDPDQEGTPF